MVATDPEALEPYLMHLVGNPKSHLPASGLVAALQSEEVETRFAAAEALRATVVQFGPRVDLAQVVHSIDIAACRSSIACMKGSSH
jgi:hypothetical protein